MATLPRGPLPPLPRQENHGYPQDYLARFYVSCYPNQYKNLPTLDKPFGGDTRWHPYSRLHQSGLQAHFVPPSLPSNLGSGSNAPTNMTLTPRGPFLGPNFVKGPLSELLLPPPARTTIELHETYPSESSAISGQSPHSSSYETAISNINATKDPTLAPPVLLLTP